MNLKNIRLIKGFNTEERDLKKYIQFLQNKK